MDPSPSRSNGTLMFAAVLVFLGRITLVYAIAFGLTHALWGYPPDIRRIYWGLFAASVLLGTAALLIGNLSWLLQILVWGIAVACLFFIGAVATAYFRRSPHILKEIELYSGLMALGFLALAYLFLRRITKREKHA